MKVILTVVMTLAALPAFARDYTCTASLDSASAALSGSESDQFGLSTTIGSYQFDVAEMTAGGLWVSIQNSSDASDSADATLIMPSKGHPASLNVVMKSGKVKLSCANP